MQLVLVAHRRRTTLEIRHISIIVSDNQRTFKLSRIPGVDAEIAAQLHGAAYPLGDIHKRAVAEHGTVQCRKEIILIRHHRSQILTHQIGMLFDSVANRAEDHPFFTKFLFEGRLHRDRVHNGIHSGITAQRQTFLKGNTQLIEGLL